MKVPVYFAAVKEGEAPDLIEKKMVALYDEAGFGQCITQNDLVAIKMHFGESGNITHIPSRYVRPVVDKIKQDGGLPFLTDTNVLYRSERSQAITHLMVAHAHGFTLENTGAPVIIADGLAGSNETEVKIPGKIYSKVSLATEAVIANALIVLSHVTGHMATGLGATLKNLGMGLASRKGKLRQHSGMRPQIDAYSCTGCELCIKWCTERAISMKGPVATINDSLCIGCGQCLTVCRFDAVRHDWRTSSVDLQKKMAEHAFGAVIDKKDKVGYMNFLISITKDCDCLGKAQKPIFPDIGIIAARDGVALDTATLDLIEKYGRRTLSSLAYSHLDPTIQLYHAQEIGMGTMNYELIEI